MQKINTSFSNVQGMFAFPVSQSRLHPTAMAISLITVTWAHPSWNGYGQNLAGGGTPNPTASGPALVEGNKVCSPNPGRWVFGGNP